MKFIVLGLLLSFSTIGAEPINKEYRDKIVAAIYKIEGSTKTRFPFGIKSIDTGGDYAKAKRICENTVANNYIRWQRAGRTNEFLVFLAERYCPTSGKNLSISEKKCNKYWLPNLKKILNSNTYEPNGKKMQNRKL